VLFQNEINLRYCASGWFYYRNNCRPFIYGWTDVDRENIENFGIIMIGLPTRKVSKFHNVIRPNVLTLNLLAPTTVGARFYT